ncbi:CobW family GTP-binding protein [Pararobbsia alpina]|uniref:Metal chaperone YciC n=1 Tax=Pararobbsia alpina TaxID=621374 RepID=A0A6S7AVV5_9BURK|nr:GTP-binding protein [Pararobbsia alpina]CAB3778855.1 Putative metal chaperone YciC [Pararobbsia alpina]
MTVHPLPVTVVSGLARAGKAALLDHLLANAGTRRLAVIRENTGDLRAEVVRIAEVGNVDAIVVESPASAEPLSIAESLVLEDDEGQTLETLITIDTMATVIDAAHFLDELLSAEGLAERGLVPDEDDRTVGELSIEQVEFCDVLVIDQTRPVEEAMLARLQQVLAKINPRAVQLVARAGDVPIEALVGAGRFDFEATASAAGWLGALGQSDATGSAIDPTDGPGKSLDGRSSGVAPFVYRARRPFHPERLFALLHQEWAGVLRSKGLFWIATRNDMAGTLSQVGGTCRHGPAGFWWAAQPADEWPEDEAFKAEIAHDWFASPDAEGRETVGDRRQELVMIGMDLDHDAWQRRLDACLLSDSEFALGKEGWRQFDDPFPQWDDDHEHGEEDEDERTAAGAGNAPHDHGHR